MKWFRIGRSFRILALLLILSLLHVKCSKLVEISNPINTITSSQVFNNDAEATAAMMAVYSQMSFNRNSQCFSNASMTIFGGVAADELDDFQGLNDEFLTNTLLSTNVTLINNFWKPAYFDIYMTNAIIEGLESSKGVTNGTKRQLLGEAKFVRAFCYFYLTNLFGDVPLELSTDALQTAALIRSPQAEVYQQIVSDLTDAQNLMIDDYSLSNGEHIRANKWAATALLARVYLYLPKPNFVGADSAASAIISSGEYSLETDLGTVFLKNSNESILQLQVASTAPPYITMEGRYLIPRTATSSPNYFLTDQLLGAFEPGDQRQLVWLSSVTYRGKQYYYPFKYQRGTAISNPPDQNNITEYYTLLRLAEQYLIRAEAEANGASGGLGGAIADLNIIRLRAGLDSLPDTLSQMDVISNIMHENRIEFFSEWGHRWFDLKRWGLALDSLGPISYKSPYISANSLLWPIPFSEIQTDPNLKQNPGYN